MSKLTYDQVTKRNQRHNHHIGLELDPLMRRLCRDDFQTDLHQAAVEPSWKQPGRSFGPSPLGPDSPKANKVTDSAGNPRIAPLSADQRLTRYATGGRPVRRIQPTDGEFGYADFERMSPQDARLHAGLLGVTLRQRRRIVHKANHATAPFGEKA
jgi:hypothetical protein